MYKSIYLLKYTLITELNYIKDKNSIFFLEIYYEKSLSIEKKALRKKAY